MGDSPDFTRNVGSAQLELGALLTAVGGTPVSATYAIPPWTHSIGIVTKTAAPGGRVAIVGTVTGSDYTGGGGGGAVVTAAQAFVIYPVAAGVDGSVTVTWTGLAAGDEIWAIAIPDPLVQFVQSTSDTINTPITQAGTINALNGSVGPMQPAGRRGLGLTIRASTLAGTLQAQYSLDGAATFVTGGQFLDLNGNWIGNALVNPVAGAAFGLLLPPGVTHFQIVCSAYVSGAVTLALGSSGYSGGFEVVALGQVGQAAVSLGQKVAAQSFPVVVASDQPNLPVSIAADSAALTVPALDGSRATYSVAPAPITLAAAATDFFTLQGVAAGALIVRILRVELLITQTGTAAEFEVRLGRRSTANTGGTSAAVSASRHRTADPGAGAAALAYTANPTALGALAAWARDSAIWVPAPPAQSERLVWTFGDRPGEAFQLASANEWLVLNLAGLTVTGGKASISVEWTESAT